MSGKCKKVSTGLGAAFRDEIVEAARARHIFPYTSRCVEGFGRNNEGKEMVGFPNFIRGLEVPSLLLCAFRFSGGLGGKEMFL